MPCNLSHRLRAALILASLPLQTMAIAALLGQERLTFAKSIGVLLTIIGVGFVLGERAFEPGNAQGWLGDSAVFVWRLGCGGM